MHGPLTLDQTLRKQQCLTRAASVILRAVLRIHFSPLADAARIAHSNNPDIPYEVHWERLLELRLPLIQESGMSGEVAREHAIAGDPLLLR